MIISNITPFKKCPIDVFLNFKKLSAKIMQKLRYLVICVQH